ncbi:MAG: 30S ribosomal protein S20 [Tepidisphaeraceae bacterium]
MAHSLSAKKRIRQNAKRRAHNRAGKEKLKDQTKSFMAVLAKGDATAAGAELNKTAAVLDRLAAKHTIHKNTASRKRSRLAKRLNGLAKTPAKA